MASARPLSTLVPRPTPTCHSPWCRGPSLYTHLHTRASAPLSSLFYSPISILSRPALRHSHMYGLSGFGEVEISLSYSGVMPSMTRAT